ncbi:MAG: outer rane lipoprotein carrier protein LolA [Bryobacterales bacterium]|jgi:outer membrane lipoprotein-sorting protein|nr:outer rane lipoprotein carrier protein LolA [Bryobacterales bacterium]
MTPISAGVLRQASLRQIVVIALTLLSLQAQAPPSAADIVHSVRETYANITQIEFSMTLTRRSFIESRITSEVTMGTRIAARFPDRLRWETDDNFAKASGADFGPTLTILDGKNTWVYLSKPNQYTVETGSDPDFLKRIDEFLPISAVKLKDEAKFLREETINANGRQVDCYVVEIPEDVGNGLYPQQWTWWVDKARHIVLRADRKRIAPRGSDEATLVYQNITINEPIPDDVFVFTPPAGAQNSDKSPP